ncbi:MAG: lipopolysaccharide biosynthesis protein RfbH [Armatimonadetes bacterium]|nr:lipopolysaccharide biosynthesis protein RfbH [Armatimonadota bacterium]
MSEEKEYIKNEILKKVKDYYKISFKEAKFVPGKTRVNYAGRYFDEKELVNLVDSSLEFWLTAGRFAEKLEKELADFLGAKSVLLVNSGSSANFLSFMALTSETLQDKRIKRGDEVITVAAAFPTTVNPIIQYGAVPVFVDIELSTYNLDCSKLKKALSSKTKALMIAHTMGNPFDIEKVKSFCKVHNLWLIEDNCDALGSKFKDKYTGTFGDIGTCSFYPAHHITTGEGGAVIINNPKLKKIVLSMRDWGRDCLCSPGQDNFCGKRFGRKYGDLPYGYDHKYVYSQFGYNFKMTDMQAAIGCAQIEKLSYFIKRRQENYAYLLEGFKKFEDIFLLPYPADESQPSWFGFLLTVKENAPFSRDMIVNYFEKNNIQTRMLFAGNLIRHPAFDQMREKGRGYKIAGGLKNTDMVMKDTFWIGVYPGMTKEKLDYIIKVAEDFVVGKR